MENQVFNIAEAAALLGVQPQTLRSYIRRGHVNAVRIGHQFRIRCDELNRILTHGFTLPEAAIVTPDPVTETATSVSK